MTIINAALKGESTYDITVGEGADYRVSAFDLPSALDLVADYLERHKNTDFYIDGLTLTIMAECSKYRTAEAFAEANKLTRCGTNGIYLEITNVKGCPNG